MRSSTGTPVSDAVKFNMADRVHRLSLTASCVDIWRHLGRASEIDGRHRLAFVSVAQLLEIQLLDKMDETTVENAKLSESKPLTQLQ